MAEQSGTIFGKPKQTHPANNYLRNIILKYLSFILLTSKITNILCICIQIIAIGCQIRQITIW